MTTTDASGKYTLMVEPGSYRVDVEPSASSPWPRLTEDGDLAVVVLQDTVHPIALPAGEVVEGTVTASDQSTPMPGASVTVFDVSCRSVPCEGTMSPSVLAKGITDMTGTFRLVVTKATP